MSDYFKKIMYPGNTQVFVLRGLTFPQLNDDVSVSQVPVSDATVLATLYDGEGNQVPGCVAIVMSPVGSPLVGDYSAIIDGALFNPDPGGDYILKVDGTESAGKLHIEYEVEVKDRRG